MNSAGCYGEHIGVLELEVTDDKVLKQSMEKGRDIPKGDPQMPVKLSLMSEETFERYCQRSMKDYAYEHVKAGNWKEEEAIQKAEEQFQQA